jgi:uncharacterized membrane protein HdeD (DUF308 family)
MRPARPAARTSYRRGVRPLPLLVLGLLLAVPGLVVLVAGSGSALAVVALVVGLTLVFTGVRGGRAF